MKKPMKGFEDFYEVYNDGRIYSKISKKFLSHVAHTGGYKRVKLKDNKMYYVHRLVSETFHGEIPAGYEINHKNLDKADNHIDNLEQITHKENQQHASKNGRWKGHKPPTRYGTELHNSKLLNWHIIFIREVYKRNLLSQLEMAKIFGVTRQTINRIINKKTWKHI